MAGIVHIQERRFVLRTRPADLENNLTATALAGGNKLSVPPLVPIDTTHGSAYSFYHLGSGLAGHRGLLHGGILGVLLDERMGLASFTVLPKHISVAASLEISYKSPLQLPGISVLKTVVEKTGGRKAWAVGTVESLDGGTVFASAKALFIELRGAECMNQLI